MRVLGIETSCDETAASVVEDGHVLLSNVVASQVDIHALYGGVVPEIAARSHIEAIIPVIDEALSQATSSLRTPTPDLRPPTSDPWDQIDAIAVTYGAGLGGSLLIGVMTARTLAITKKKPLYAINHVEGHLYANFITEFKGAAYALPKLQPQFPLLGLIVSGGHSQLAYFKDHFDYELIGVTYDDAIGEAFDKVAKMLGLPYPGGVSVSKLATSGNSRAYTLPKSKIEGEYNFSFSGLKTAVLRLGQHECGHDYTLPSIELPGLLSEAQKRDIAATFQRVAIETIVDKTVKAYQHYSPASVIIGGGVASSQELRRQLSERLPFPIEYTDPKLCTDNAAMIAALGCFKAMHHQETADPYSLAISPNLKM